MTGSSLTDGRIKALFVKEKVLQKGRLDGSGAGRQAGVRAQMKKLTSRRRQGFASPGRGDEGETRQGRRTVELERGETAVTP